MENAFKGPLTDLGLHHPARRTCLRFAKTSFRLDWLYEAMTALEEARAPQPATPA